MHMASLDPFKVINMFKAVTCCDAQRGSFRKGAGRFLLKFYFVKLVRKVFVVGADFGNFIFVVVVVDDDVARGFYFFMQAVVSVLLGRAWVFLCFIDALCTIAKCYYKAIIVFVPG